MPDRNASESDGESIDGIDAELSAVSSNYKILGEIDDSGGGIGTLGRNTASSGTTRGVEGRVASSSGYGLYTPDDAKVGGELTATNVATDRLDVVHTLPPYDQIGNDPQRVRDALSMLFDDTPWADPYYVSNGGDSKGFAFVRGAVTPDGTVVLAPQSTSEIGLYDPETNTYTNGPQHNEGNNAFKGAALAPNGTVVLAPDASSNVGIYDPTDNSYIDGPSVGSDSFSGAVLAPSGNVILVPYGSGEVGIYDPTDGSDGSYTSGPSHDEGSDAFTGGALTPDGKVVFAPNDSSNVGVYDPSDGSYTTGPSHNEASSIAFSGAALAPPGVVVFAPYSSENVGIYDPADGSYTSGPSHGEGDFAFTDAVLSPTGEVVFAPYGSDNVGRYDPVTNTYTSGPSHGESDQAFLGAVLTGEGTVVFTGGKPIPYLETNAQTERPLATALHPLVNNS